MLAEASAETRSFAARPDRIPELDDWIERTGAAWRVREDVLFRGRVCVAEIAANLLEHGHAEAADEPMTVTLQTDGSALEIEVTDGGRAFDPTAPSAAIAAPDSPRGRGLRLLGAYAAMSYRRDGGHNILRLRVSPP